MVTALSILAVNGIHKSLCREIDLLASAGHVVHHAGTGAEALERAIAEQPDCVLIDLMLPDMDGLKLCHSIKNHPACEGIRVVFVSSKPYALDRKRALEMGADGYLQRPMTPEQFRSELTKALDDKVELTFWGVRGTLPVCGPDALRYGGNTSCVSLEFARAQSLIFDAGSGIKQLSDSLATKNLSNFHSRIFISHPHWDHINALPFFAPLYQQGNEIEILGASHGDISMRELIAGQMDGIYFPVNLNQFAARVYFRNLCEETVEFDGIKVSTMLLNHPGYCLGYRVDYRDRSFCYITDNELFPKDSQHLDPVYRNKLIQFIKGADTLIMDTTYSDEEYPAHTGWGHSCVREVVDVAHEAQAKQLCLFHHDPAQTDADIDHKLGQAQARLRELESSTEVIAPSESTTLTF